MNTEFLKRLMVTGVAIVMFFTDLALSIVPWSPENKKIAEIQKNPLALPSSFMITAHAGAMSMPDNSIEALTVAVSAGVDAVELDLSFRPDGTPVIIHDSAPSQKAGVSLDEAFGVIAKDSKIRINLDMKSVKNLPGVYELLVKHTLENRAFFTGVDEFLTDMIKSQCPIPYYLNAAVDKKRKDSREYANELAARMKAGGFVGLNCSFSEISRTVVETLHENGLLVSVWTVNKKIDMVRCLALSVDNITTRMPKTLMQIIDDWK